MISPIRRVYGSLSIACAIGAVGAVVLPVSAAQAGLLNPGSCKTSALSQAFAPWGDSASYELVPGGDFEISSWSLSGGAQRVSGSEPYAATGKLGAWSVSLPAGASAESPATCVDTSDPTIRFFMAGSGVVAVSVVYAGLPIPAGVAIAPGGWQPTPVMLTESPLLGLLLGGSAQVSLQLTTVLGDPQVDDVFIDPWNRG
ncbi:MAG TPA: hypothetical protein VGL69_18030 [Solirubrobacteraceae bacterium]